MVEAALAQGFRRLERFCGRPDLLKDCKKLAKSIYVGRSYSHYRLLAQFMVTYSAEKRSYKLIIKFFYGLGFRG